MRRIVDGRVAVVERVSRRPEEWYGADNTHGSRRATVSSFIPTEAVREPTDFGDREYRSALVNVTNVCNLSCTHCFVFRADNPNKPQDKMDDATMLHQLEALRDKHHIRS